MSLLETLRKTHGPEYHPAILLAEVSADTSEDIKLRVDCAKTLMPYVEATLKSVELRGAIDHRVGLLRVSMFEDDAIEGEITDMVENDQPAISEGTPALDLTVE